MDKHPEIFRRINQDVGVSLARIAATVSLLGEGATIPFIARYRKEATDNLDEVRIRDIAERVSYYFELEERRGVVLSSIERQGKLTDELRGKIQECWIKHDLEDLYLPYRPKRRTKASAARDRGLEPLADHIEKRTGPPTPEEFATSFVSEDKVVPSVEDAPAQSPDTEEQTDLPPTEESAASLLSNGKEVPSAEEAPTPSLNTEEQTDPVATEQAPAPLLSDKKEVPSVEEAPAQSSDTEEPTAPPATEESAAPLLAEEKEVPNAEEAPAQSSDTEEQAAPPATEESATPLLSEEKEVPGVEDAPAGAIEVEKTEPPATEESATPLPSKEKEVASVEDALTGALDILAERFAENPECRQWLREFMLKEGTVEARVRKGKEDQKTKYAMYYDFKEAIPRIPSHRMLAIRRGSREKVLAYSIQIDRERALAELRTRFDLSDGEGPFVDLLRKALEDGFTRLMEPAIQNEVRGIMRSRADEAATRMFEENLRSLLLAPPAGSIPVAGIDPGLRTGSKIAVVDGTGKFLEHNTLFLTEPKQDLEAAEKILVEIVEKHKIRGIVMGNGTGSRETESFVRTIVDRHKLDVFTVVTSEAGASVYSASKRAREEFPELDVTIRGAVSIARRLQDPLAELVKIDPKAIGVGQYQHDVDQRKLKSSLGAVVESSVNAVGVDINTASVDLLRYVAGISSTTAEAVVERRNSQGAFTGRDQLMEVAGVGEKTFQQSAGFLRIPGAANPLDRTAVHPESYAVVERMAASLDDTVTNLIENPKKVTEIDFVQFEKDVGKYTLADIRQELLRPGRDPRKSFQVPRFRDDVREIKDLAEGMEMEGAVTNVTNFGAFVDLGVHQDGLVHISELSHRYVSDARQAVQVGDVVKVKVIGVDPAMKRISLSIKALLPKPRPPKPKRKPAGAGNGRPIRKPRESTVAVRKKRPAPKPEPQLSMEEKIRRLQEKFKSPGN